MKFHLEGGKKSRFLITKLKTLKRIRAEIIFGSFSFLCIFLTKIKYCYKITLLFKSVMRPRGQRETANEESPGFAGTGCRRNPGEGNFKESATENYRLYR